MEVLNIVFLILPLVMILWLANYAERQRSAEEPNLPAKFFAYGLVAFLYLGALLFAASMSLAAFALQVDPALADTLGAQAGLDDITIESPLWLSVGVILPALMGLLLLTPPLRRLAGRVLPLDPASPVHAVALSLSMLVFVAMGVTLGIGLGTFTAQLTEQIETSGSQPLPLGALWAQAGMFVLLALVGVGWGTRRSLGATLARLGIVRPTGKEVLIGVGAALVMVPVVVAMESLANLMGMGVPQDIESLSDMLLGPLFETPWGILSVGLAAALGEEPLFRGALQPRFGLFVTALLFALVHNNYGLSFATIVVFVLGLVLGLERIRFNTTTAIITHATYNSLLGVLAYLAAQFAMQQ
jgi:membrane protease YdiL (CAAX protease family)